MSDQAQRLRELAQSSRTVARADGAPGSCRVVTVASGKGGVGKSVFTVNLAFSLARLHKKVLIVDADLGLAAVNLLTDCRPEFNLCDVIEGRARLEQCVVACGGGDVRMLHGGSGIARMADLPAGQVEFLVRCFEQLQQEADFMLIDSGAGIASTVIRFCLAADELVAVTTPDPTAIADVYALIKAVFSRNRDADIRVCVNMCRAKSEADGVSRRIRSVARQFIGVEPGDAGHIPWDPAVARSVREKQPFAESAPQAESSRQVMKMAQELVRRSGGRSVNPAAFRALSNDLVNI